MKNKDAIEPGKNRRKAIERLSYSIAGLFMLGVAACAPQQPTSYTVTIQVFQGQSHYAPSELVIPPGSTVVWQNRSIYPGTITCDPSKAKASQSSEAGGVIYASLPGGAQPFDSGVLYPGQTWSHTFKTSGRYLYFSQYDQNPGLIGVVTVQA